MAPRSAARARLTPDRVVDAAAELVDRDGLEALTLARLAQRLGIRPPSLYNHVDGLDGLRRRLRLRALAELAEALQRAATGRAGGDALCALAHAYRDYARRRPGLYRLTQQVPAAGRAAETPEGKSGAGKSGAGKSGAGESGTGEIDLEVARAADAVVEVVRAALRGYDLRGEAALHATRALRSALHGFVLLETGGGFGLPLDRDESFRCLLDLLDAGLRGAPPPED